MSGKGSKKPGRDPLALANALGNYSDVSAAASRERGLRGDIADADSGIFDIETDEGPLLEAAAESASPVGPADADPDEDEGPLVAAHEPPAKSPVRDAVVPLLGMRMAVPSIDLGFARLLRAGELDELPDEATGSDENVFALIGSGGSMQAPLAATQGLMRLVTTLRLMKRGGVGLAAHGWMPGLGGWQRFSTGVARPRPGGYELSPGEADGLAELSRQIESRGERTPSFAWALSRFDLGAERTNQVEALSDYLLALRALLEGGGPAKAALVARAAALCAGPAEREPIRVELERALALERKLMSGARMAPGDGSPLEAIGAAEEALRTMLRGMATGELGSDLRITADEILLADGLRSGEGSVSQLGGTAEWRVADREETAAWRLPDLAEAERIVAEHGALSSNIGDDETHALDQIEPAAGPTPPPVELPLSMEDRGKKAPQPPEWLPTKSGEELDWPAFASRKDEGVRRAEGERASSERVRFLFQMPDTDWSAAAREVDVRRKRDAS